MVVQHTPSAAPAPKVKEEEVKLIAAGCETSADGSIPQSEALPALELFHRIVDTQMKDDSCVVM